jgi:hypothetical protein
MRWRRTLLFLTGPQIAYDYNILALRWIDSFNVFDLSHIAVSCHILAQAQSARAFAIFSADIAYYCGLQRKIGHKGEDIELPGNKLSMRPVGDNCRLRWIR